jgi:hypothetical protein
MMSGATRRYLIILSWIIMIGSLITMALLLVVGLYVETTTEQLSHSMLDMFLESQLGGLIMGLLAGATLRTLLSIEARLEARN